MSIEHDLTISIPESFGTRTTRGVFESVSWFLWSDGLDCTYFYRTASKWDPYNFTNVKASESVIANKYGIQYTIPKQIMRNDFLHNHGFPVKGRGIVNGIGKKDNYFFVSLILTDMYLQHIKIECSEDFIYTDGKIYVPPSWDTVEKRNSILYKEYIGRVGFVAM